MSERTCLIPISVSGKRFSTETFLPALRAIEKNYDRAVFLVADTLQIYNRAAEARNAADVSSLIGSSKPELYLDERRSWLRRLRSELNDSPIASASWEVKGIDDFSCRNLTAISRITAVLFSVDARFRGLVEADARQHVFAHAADVTQGVRLRLSQFYLLEELSINLFLHCIEGLSDEYYLDSTLPSVRALYNGQLAIAAADILASIGLHTRAAPFSFFAFDERVATWSVVPGGNATTS